VPFASAHALFNLSKLAVWWLRLGIERIQPGAPQQNGRHERMHLNRRDYLSELGWSLLRRDVGSSICPEGSSVFRPNGLPLPVRNIG
jgi:hypothetical protein